MRRSRELVVAWFSEPTGKSSSFAEHGDSMSCLVLSAAGKDAEAAPCSTQLGHCINPLEAVAAGYVEEL